MTNPGLFIYLFILKLATKKKQVELEFKMQLKKNFPIQ